MSPTLVWYIHETTWRINFNMLSNSSFDACSSARKTFVYARMLTIEYNPHWREKSAFCLFMCRYVLRSIDTFIRSTTTTIITNTKRRILILRVFIILSSRHIHSYRIFNQYIKDSDKIAFIFVESTVLLNKISLVG